MHDQPDRLVDHQDRLVLVQDRELHRVAAHCPCGSVCACRSSVSPSNTTVARGPRLAVDAQLALADPLLQPRAREFRQQPRRRLVEAQPGVLPGDEDVARDRFHGRVPWPGAERPGRARESSTHPGTRFGGRGAGVVKYAACKDSKPLKRNPDAIAPYPARRDADHHPGRLLHVQQGGRGAAGPGRARTLRHGTQEPRQQQLRSRDQEPAAARGPLPLRPLRRAGTAGADLRALPQLRPRGSRGRGRPLHPPASAAPERGLRLLHEGPGGLSPRARTCWSASCPPT